MKFSKFMASSSGRILRVIAGVVIIALGIEMKSNGGYILAVVGLLPLAAGVFDWCIIAKLLHLPLRGKEIRAL